MKTPRIAFFALIVIAQAAAAPLEFTPDGVDAAMISAGFFPVAVQFDAHRQFRTSGSINGRTVQFLIDSGWTISDLDNRLAAELPTLASMHGVLASGVQARRSPEKVHIVANLTVGACRFSNVPFGGFDVVRSMDASGGAVNAVLGFDFLTENHCALRIVPPRIYFRSVAAPPDVRNELEERMGRLGFIHAPVHNARFVGPDLQAGGKLTTNAWPTGLCVTAAVEGKPVEFLVDTGASLSLIDDSMSAPLRLSPKRARSDPAHISYTRENFVKGVGGIRQEFLLSRSIGLEFPGFTNRAEPFGVADLAPWRRVSGGGATLVCDGFLGADRLLRANAVIDFGGNELYWYTWPKSGGK
jgi:predicted aspartyl protease